MQKLSIDTESSKSSPSKEDKEQKRQEHTEKIKDEKFIFLTAKYHTTIKRGIENAAKQGKRERYINFDREDFKANCDNLGYPNQFQKLWLAEMCNQDSKYLPRDEEGVNIHFSGIKYDIWNNAAFTTVFKW